jgi:hypothetical protein
MSTGIACFEIAIVLVLPRPGFASSFTSAKCTASCCIVRLQSDHRLKIVPTEVRILLEGAPIRKDQQQESDNSSEHVCPYWYQYW